MGILAGEPEILGTRCMDGGTCHHSCSSESGCFRKSGCSPFDQSGLDNEWRPRDSLVQIQAEVCAWAEGQFGPARQDAAWKKLFEELGEVIRDPEDPSEWADVFIILFDLAKLNGVENLSDAIRNKMETNARRRWTTSKTGVMIHVKHKAVDVECVPPVQFRIPPIQFRAPARTALSVSPLPSDLQIPMVVARGLSSSFTGGPLDGKLIDGMLECAGWQPAGYGGHYYLDGNERAPAGETVYYYKWSDHGTPF